MIAYEVGIHVLYLIEPQHCSKFSSCFPEIKQSIVAESVVKMKNCELLQCFEMFSDQSSFVLHHIIRSESLNQETID